MNKKLVIGNWKMYLTVPESTVLIEKLKKELGKVSGVEVVVCPTFLDIYAASKELAESELEVGAQNLFYEEEGAYTGEISALQLAHFVKYCIIGHSERRAKFGEKDRDVARKVEAAVSHGIVPIICVGETYHERGDGLSKVVVMNQLETALSQLTASEVADVVVAYEPVWAISTSGSIPCKPSDAEKMAKDIRGLVSALYGKATGEQIRVLFGGNVNPENAESFAKAKYLDGALVGAASRDHAAFTAVAKEYAKLGEKLKSTAKPATKAKKKTTRVSK